jgi:hypothetical protein
MGETFTATLPSSTLTFTQGFQQSFPLLGCTDPTAFNYNSSAGIDDGSCIPMLTCSIAAPSSTLCSGEPLELFAIVNGEQFGANSQNSTSISFTSGNYIRIPYHPDFSNMSQFTLECWYWQNGFDGGDERIVGTEFFADGYSIENQHGDWSSRLCGPSNCSALDYWNGNDNTPPIQEGQWNHFAICYDGTNSKYFLNGQLLKTETLNYSSISAFQRDIVINRHTWNGGSSSRLNGLMDELRLSSVSRYNDNFNLQSMEFVDDANTIGLWHMNEGSGSTIIDASGNGHHGFAQGSISWSQNVPFSSNLSTEINWSNGATTSTTTVTPTANTTYSCAVTQGAQTCTATYDVTVTPSQTWYQDADGDGEGNPNVPVSYCFQPLGFVTNNNDCDDNNANINFFASEVCDGLDNNCNGLIDDGLQTISIFIDTDLDGVGSMYGGETCNFDLLPGFSYFDGDCDDNDAMISPFMNEVCNGVDDNCNGEINEGLGILVYLDDDGDGYGNDGVAVDGVCELAPGLVEIGGDCNDQDASVNPAGFEICGDGMDNNCDGLDEMCPVFGCTDPTAFNYNPIANTDDGSCVPVIFGCTNDFSLNYNPAANVDDGSCIPFVYGCTDVSAFNYNPTANTDDGSCIPFVYGCTDVAAFNYNPTANTDDGSCIPFVYGCTDVAAFNYNPTANTDDGSCIPFVYGCTDVAAFNYNASANTDDGSCVPVIFGCTNDFSLNYNPAANVDDGSCIPFVYGCTDVAAFNYNPTANTDDGSCIPFVYGCTDVAAFNYNPTANTDDGSCIPFVYGCTDPLALNYTPAANTDDGSCIAVVLGCTDVSACNYDLNANVENGSCILPQPEICNDLDDDCNGLTDDGLPILILFTDLDGDGAGVGAGIVSCSFIPGYAGIDGDCDDNDANVYPWANEICNTIDENCNGVLNDGLWIAAYIDADGDGYGYPGISVDGLCELTPGYSGNNGDCEDNDPAINPAVIEVCNGLDDNCDGQTDEGLLLMFYADLDQDGFGSMDDVTLSCTQPNGYVLDNSDCDDWDAMIYPGATEICDNGIDEDCNGLDTTCIILVEGCTDINACNYNPLATMDDGSCISIQPEICNGLDDDCDGLVDEGLSLSGVNVVTAETALYPTCVGNSIRTANLLNGTNTSIIEGDGHDLWYSFNAQNNSLRVGLSAAMGDNEVRLYKMANSGCMELIETEHEVTTGNQTLISDQLLTGQTYYVAVHNINGAMNASAKICFNHLTGSICDHYYSNNTGIYSSVCNSFKAQYRANAIAYSFEVLSATQNGVNQNITPWSYTTTSASSVVPRLGSILPANQSASAMVYTLRVPVVYSLPDAAGNFEVLTASATSTCLLTLSAETAISLRSSDRCPTNKSLSSYIAPDRTVCGAMRYDWEFTEVLPNPTGAQVVQGGAYSGVFFLSNVPGIAAGKTYSVRVRPVHSSGTLGNWGAAHCLRIGSAGMILQHGSESKNEKETLLGNQLFSVYPNPTSTGSFILEYNQMEDGVASSEMLIMRDVTGKVVYQHQFVLNGGRLEVHFGDLANGLYLVEFGNDHKRIQVMK